MRMRALLAVLVGTLSLAGCSAQPPTEAPSAAVESSNYTPVLSLNQMMVAVVDSHSHEIWDVVEKAPATEEEWEALEHAAATLAAAGSLTRLSGNGPDDQRWLAEPQWAANSQTLADAGLAAFRAVNARDVDGVNKAGDQLVLTCINCHNEYRLNVPRIWSDHETRTGQP